MVKETDIMRLIQIEATRQNIRLFRYNVGLFYTKNLIPIRCGTPGVSDLIGFTDTGRFVAVEVKTPAGRLSEEQTAFLLQVQKSNGIAFVAHSVQEFVDKLKTFN